MNRINFKGKDGGGFHHLTPYQKKSRRRSIKVITKIVKKTNIKKDHLYPYDNLTADKLENILIQVFDIPRKNKNLYPGVLIKKPIEQVEKILDKIEVINEPNTYKDKKGFKIYHSHQKFIKHNQELCVTDSIGGCGMQQFYGWSSNSNYEISVELINYYLKHKPYGVGLVICQLGQDYFNNPFEKALITCGFKVSDEYSNYQHDSRGTYKQRVYSLQTKYKYD